MFLVSQRLQTSTVLKYGKITTVDWNNRCYSTFNFDITINVKGHTLIFIGKKKLMLGFEACYPCSITTVDTKNRDEIFFTKINK